MVSAQQTELRCFSRDRAKGCGKEMPGKVWHSLAEGLFPAQGRTSEMSPKSLHPNCSVILCLWGKSYQSFFLLWILSISAASGSWLSTTKLGDTAAVWALGPLCYILVFVLNGSRGQWQYLCFTCFGMFLLHLDLPDSQNWWWLSDRGMVLCLLGTSLWKLPGTCSANLNFSWDSPDTHLILPYSHVPRSLRQREHFYYCWNHFQSGCSDFSWAFTQCLCCVVGTWLTLCWTTFLLNFYFEFTPSSSSLLEHQLSLAAHLTCSWGIQ